jgi:hypothetical protein
MSWENKYERAAKRGPVPLFLLIFFVFVGVSVVIGATGYFLGWFGEAAQVAQKEFGPQAALEKYMWFINQANAIEKMDKDVAMYEDRVTNVDKQYAAYGEDKTKWALDIRVQYNHERQQAREDLLAVASQRNSLVQEYNAASDKFNWAPFQTRPDKPKVRFHEYDVK